jgi:hypothetical protein
MSNPFKLAIDVSTKSHLLVIRGSLIPPTVEEARKTHNMTAGNPDGVAAAQSLGDLTHSVYVPLGKGTGVASELLIMDQWNSLPGLDRFFSNPDVQKGGGMIFASRDRGIFEPAAGFPSVHLPWTAPKKDRFVGLARGPVRSKESAQKIIDNMFVHQVNRARRLGLLSREYYFKMGADQPELLGVDVWHCEKGMIELYSSPEEMNLLTDLFTAPPATSVWQRPAGEWVEW